MKKALVMKFGGASVATPEQFHCIADLILSRQKHFPQIAVVVSAMANTTDGLIRLAKQVNPDPPRREYDMLVTVGERISISLLAMALIMKGKQAISFTGSQSGIITCSRHTDARIIDVRPHRIQPYLEREDVVIVAGFQGVSSKGEITTLGRGGSDTSAVALGVALGATRVEFFKDVPGIFSDDPKRDPNASLIPSLTYQQAITVSLKGGAKVLHPRCIELAEKNQMPLYIHSFQESETSQAGTVIGERTGTRPESPQYEEHQEVVSSHG